MEITLIIILIISGVLTNVMSALFGIGGGVLMVPILHTLFPELPYQMISATSLTIVMSSSLINVIAFYRQKIQINYKAMLLWSVGMLIGVQLGFESSFYVPEYLIITVFIATLTLLSAQILLLKSKNETVQPDKNETFKGIALCCLGGGIAGMTGVGGGSILAPLIGQLRSVEVKKIAVYTNYMMVIGGIGSLYGYITKVPPHQVSSWQLGYIDLSIVGLVVFSSFITSFFSMKLKGKLSPTTTKRSLGIILLAIALYMLVLQIYNAI